MHRMNRQIVFVLLLTCSAVSRAQERPIHLGTKLHPAGSIIPHSEDIRQLAQGVPRGFQLEVSRFNISKESWESCHCFARTGWALSIFDYGKPKQLGQSYNLIYFVEPYLKPSGRLKFSYRAGMGLSYLTKVYDEQANPDNLFFSNQISGLLLVGLHASYELNPSWSLNSGVSYQHISNGGLRQPNKGMNFPTLTIGLDHVLRPYEGALPAYSIPPTDKSIRFFTKLIWTNKTVDADDEWPEVQKNVVGLEAGVLKPISPNHGLSIGVEMLSDGAWEEQARRLNEDYSPLSGNVLIGHHFLIGRFSFSQQAGIYTLKKYPRTPASWYQRYGLDYMMTDHMQFGFTLKAHGHVAEIMDLRLGWVF